MATLLDFGYLVAAMIAAPWLLRKKRSGWRERLGHGAPAPPRVRARLLIHAVSVGEVNLLRRLVPTLSQSVDVVVSVTTDTGIERARALFGPLAPAVQVVRFPLDFSASVRRFLDAVRPDAVALVELELWPNFLRECRRRGVPAAIINGRLSDRSFRRYRALRPVLGRFFSSLAFIAAQDEQYAARFVAVGASPDRVEVAGSMKWDATEVAGAVPGADALARDLGIDRARPLIVAGSTAPDEHALLHSATPRGAQLLCAPRRPEWFDQAARDLPGCVRRSASGGEQAADGQRGPGADRFLLDSIGELRQAYALADIVVIGRSFGGLHGSDPLEAAALAKPLVIGPAFADFRSIVETLQHAGAILQTTRDGLAGDLSRLVEHADLRARLSEQARACIVAHQGATARHVSLLIGLLAKSSLVLREARPVHGNLTTAPKMEGTSDILGRRGEDTVASGR